MEKRNETNAAGEERRALWERFLKSGRIGDYLAFSRYGREEGVKNSDRSRIP